MPNSKHSSLDAYRTKRSADRTPEPFGSHSPSNGWQFVVQHHAARHLHYDLRLEMEGVLRSWAVPKGPSPNPQDKRLAVHVEDHPLDYADFEGAIPEGNYGAGAVIVWDRGQWIPLNDPLEGLAKGKLLFELHGYKLRGKWTLVKTKRNEKDWLLIKENDGFISTESTDSYPADSILSGQTVAELADHVNPGASIRKSLARYKTPRKKVSSKKLKVMLAQNGKPFSRKGWLYEIKYDGYRLIAAKDGDTVNLMSRAGNDLTVTFPDIAATFSKLPFSYLLLDGEVVVHDANGLPSFSRLQKRGRLTRSPDSQRAAKDLPATFYAFDCLAFDDFDLRPLNTKQRKTILKKVLPSVGPIRYSDHIEQHGEAMFDEVCKLGLEGIVAKRMDCAYVAGRSAQWIKVSAEKRADYVIAGYTNPKGSRSGFGALLLACYAGESLVYVGRVGSGFTNTDQKELGPVLSQAPTGQTPANAPVEKGQHWKETGLVCEVKYKQITPDGLLRQPVFLRQRDDKHPSECVRESILTLEESTGPSEKETRAVPFTNLDKIYWPEDNFSKGDLIEYYENISGWLLPYLENRPVVLDRYPDGIDGKSFYQKDAPAFVPDWIRTEHIWSEQSQREIGYFIVEDPTSLLYIINLGTIPLHVWSSRIDTLEQPDWCILDLDPKGAPFAHVIEIAKSIHQLCESVELPNFLKTSGSSGLHVLIPLGAQYTYEQSRTLAELLARVVCRELPGIATVTRSVSNRDGKVYVDYGQNGHGRLLVSTYSVRPLPLAPVSMPLGWKELTSKLNIKRFTIKSAAKRMRSLNKDPLLDVLTLKPDLAGALERLANLFST